MKKTPFLVFLFLMVLQSFSQRKREIDSTYIRSFVDKIIVKANIDTQLESFTIRSNNESDIKIATNNQIRLNLSLDYEFIGASIGFSPKFIPGNNDDNLKGKSSFIDYKFRFFFGNWIQEIQYRRNEGFYVENTNDFQPNWISGRDPYIQFSDLKSILWRGSTSYVLNPNFSLRNVVYNTEWQLKSAGSFVPTLKYNFTRLSGTIDANKSYENSFTIGFAPEYYYTAVLQKNWFASVFVSPTVGLEFAKSGEDGVAITEHKVYAPISLDAGLQLGYSAKRFIWGLNVKLDNTWYNQDRNTSVLNNSLFGRIYVGYRFNTPKKIQKTFDWFNDKLGL